MLPGIVPVAQALARVASSPRLRYMGSKYRLAARLADVFAEAGGKRFTPFSYKRTIVDALRQTFKQFSASTIVLSYSSNAVPDLVTIKNLLGEVKGDVGGPPGRAQILLRHPFRGSLKRARMPGRCG